MTIERMGRLPRMKKESEDYEINSYRNSSIYPFMTVLCKGIFHRTSVEGYRGMLRDGLILSNTGSFPFSYPQSKTYYGYSKGYISLFDFESSREEDYLTNYHTWEQFFFDHKPVTIVLRLNRGWLAPKLIPNSERPQIDEQGYKASIPYVEVWYPEPIPLSVIDDYFITWDARDSDAIRWLHFPKNDLSAFEEVLTWVESTNRTPQLSH